MPPTTRNSGATQEDDADVNQASYEIGKMKETVDLIDSSVVAEFEVVGKPRPQPRPRFAKHTGHAYKSKSAAAYETAFRRAAMQLLQGTNFSVPGANFDVEVHMVYYLARPKSHFRGNKFGNPLRPSATRVSRMGGDLDNYIKFTMDALKGIIFEDDKQVIELHAKKAIAQDGIPKTVVKVISDGIR